MGLVNLWIGRKFRVIISKFWMLHVSQSNVYLDIFNKITYVIQMNAIIDRPLTLRTPNCTKGNNPAGLGR